MCRKCRTSRSNNHDNAAATRHSQGKRRSKTPNPIAHVSSVVSLSWVHFLGTTSTVEPCDICGGIGFDEVIVTCSKCNIAREHVYCMRIYLKEVPDYWLCEACQSKSGPTSPKCGGNQMSRDFGSDASDTHHDIGHTISSSKVDKDSFQQASKGKRSFPTGKVKFIPEDEVIKISCGSLYLKPILPNSTLLMNRKTSIGSKSAISNTPALTMKSNPSIVPRAHWKLPRNGGVRKNPMTGQHASRLSSKVPVVVSASVQKAPITLAEKDDCREQCQSSIRPVNRAETSKAVTDKTNDKASNSLPTIFQCIITADNEVQTFDLQNQIEKPKNGTPCEASSARKSSPIVGSGGVLCAVAEFNSSNIEKGNLESLLANFKLYHPFLPSSLPTWRGGFHILQAAASVEFYDGFDAQPPCTVNSKAYKFSTRMPSILQLESLPMSNILTNVFQNDCPDLQDIALYFFPSDNIERHRKNLNSLFEFMDDRKTMLRGFIDGVELLVFTSEQLNVDSRGTMASVTAGHFLWGIFRQRKIDIAIERLPDMEPVHMNIDMVDGKDVSGDKAIERLPDMEPLDMDIDMVGGKDVLGRIDYVQKDKPRSLSERSLEGTLLQITCKEEYSDPLDVPPGFEAHAKMCPGKTAVDPLGKVDVRPAFQAHAKEFSGKTAVDEEKAVVNGGRSDSTNSSGSEEPSETLKFRRLRDCY